MEIIYKEYKHNPPHLFLPHSKYFITGATYNKKKWFKSNETRGQLLKIIKIGFERHRWKLEDWVILDNHYHIMGNAPHKSDSLPKMMKNIHKFVALWVKKNVPESKSFKKIMYNYWDSCISYEASYFARLNYIWHNPVKHGYVEQAEEWKFSSFCQRIETEREEVEKIKEIYPCDKVKVKDDF